MDLAVKVLGSAQPIAALSARKAERDEETHYCGCGDSTGAYSLSLFELGEDPGHSSALDKMLIPSGKG